MPPVVEPVTSRMKEYVDWAVRGAVGGLCTGALALVVWGVDVQTRLHDAELSNVDLISRVAKLETKQDGYQDLRTDIAVLKTQLDAQDKKFDRIEALLMSERGR